MLLVYNTDKEETPVLVARLDGCTGAWRGERGGEGERGRVVLLVLKEPLAQ